MLLQCDAPTFVMRLPSFPTHQPTPLTKVDVGANDRHILVCGRTERQRAAHVLDKNSALAHTIARDLKRVVVAHLVVTQRLARGVDG